MDVIFYNISDDERKINKTLVDGITLDCNVRRDVDIYNPFFLVKKSDNFNPQDYNYIGWHNKYYFIRDINYTAKGMFRIDTHIDVLMSYKDSILSATSLITQSTEIESFYNGGDYISKETFESTVYKSDVTLKDLKNIVLVTIGGV